MYLATTRRPKNLADGVRRATGFHPLVHKSLALRADRRRTS